MTGTALVTGFVLLAFSTSLPAQPPAVATGQRVRIESPTLRGEFIASRVSADEIVLVDESGTVSAPILLSDITTLDVYRGRRSGRTTVNYALTGAGVGAMIGAIAFAEGGEGCGFYELDCVETSTGETAAIVAPIALGVAGGVIGVLFARRRADTWERVIGGTAGGAR